MLGYLESQVPELSTRNIIFFCRIPTRVITVQSTNVTDGQTGRHGNTALRYASRGKKPLAVGASPQTPTGSL